MLIKRAAAAAVLAAPWMLPIMTAPVAHAVGSSCIGLAPSPGGTDWDAYNSCMSAAHAACHQTGGFPPHVACTYPGGGRDECDEHPVLGPLGTFASDGCRYVPPGA